MTDPVNSLLNRQVLFDSATCYMKNRRVLFDCTKCYMQQQQR